MVALFLFCDVSCTASAAILNDTVPLQSLYFLPFFLPLLKLDTTTVYLCPTVFELCIPVPFISEIDVIVVVTSAVSPFINVVILAADNFVLIYLSFTSNTIVSLLFVASFVDDTFSITGFIKSTNPIEKSCCLLEFPLLSVIVPAAILITVLPLHSK